MSRIKLTPVRYPGGKSNAMDQIMGREPAYFEEYREPFFGGGSVGLAFMQKFPNCRFWINDLFFPVYAFWKTIYERPEDMVKFILEQKTKYTIADETRKKGVASESAKKGRELHTYCRATIQETIKAGEIFETGCLWYILNKTSYSGMSMIGSYAPLAWDQNFSLSCINRLPETSNLMNSLKYKIEITQFDYNELLTPKGDDVFIFMDPPYLIPHNLYGDKGNMHEGFPHEEFAEKCRNCNHNWMITYNDDPIIRDWFKDTKYELIQWKLQYTMKAQKKVVKEVDGEEKSFKTGKKGNELLILNYHLPKNDATTHFGGETE